MAPGTAIDLTTIRVRPVQGRTVDPFRGSADADVSTQRLASREADSQPWDEVLAAIERMQGVVVKRAGRRLALERADETLKVAFVSGAPRVSLDDLVIEGDGRLAIAVMHALLPLFGPVEICIGRYDDLIDGHEPAAAVVERFDAWFIEDSLRVAKKLGHQAAAASIDAPAAPIARARRVSPRVLALAALGLVVLLVAVPLVWSWATAAKLGEACVNNDDCRSDRCLPREPVTRIVINGYKMPPAGQVSDTRGVCTDHCTRDSDCPASMTCEALVSIGQFGIASDAMGCVPRAWAHAHAPVPATP